MSTLRFCSALLGLGLSTVLLGSARAQTVSNLTGDNPSSSVPPVTLPPNSPSPYSQFFVFGDSLSDTGNVAATVNDDTDGAVSYPSNDFNYANGRFTNDGGTNPPAVSYQGVWHEQLATLFFGIKAPDPSLNGGTDYAFGDAETLDGQRAVTEGSGDASVTIHLDNLNRQVSNYLNQHTPDPTALYIVWAGSNDLLDSDSTINNPANAATNETAVVRRLAEAGATTFLLPNVPPLGLTPDHYGSVSLTAAASAFRDDYNADLDALQTTLANEGLTVTFYRLDIFDLFNRLIASNGAAYGFANITDASQGASVKADQYLSWDGLHPTTYGHFQIAAEAYSLLTGIPVVEVYQLDKHVDRNAGDTGEFLLTRTGPDLSAVFKVGYTLSGAAVEGTDYETLSGHKKMTAGQRTRHVVLTPTAGSDSVKVKLTLAPGDDYALPPIVTGKINLDPSE